MKVDKRAELAVIVISYGPRATLVDAVSSVLEQGVVQEVVVVHSGPGDPRPALAAADLDVDVIMSEAPLLAGGARNLGVARTTAPIVAFLADDCTAAPGWSQARLDRHRDGAEAVASALVSHRPDHPTSLAIHLSRHIRRMPLIPADRALRFGASYRRSLLDRHGRFREDMPSGEDAEYNDRVRATVPILWAPEVITAHRGLERLLPALADQYRRGRLRARSDRERGSFVRRGVREIVRTRVRFMRRFAITAVGPDLRTVIRRGRPALLACIVAYAVGEWAEGRRR
jgi:GT2 family glycosyltransferase